MCSSREASVKTTVERLSKSYPDTVVGSYAAGLYGLVRGLALELKPVRVNLVQPGRLATDLWKDMEPDKREAL